MVSRGDIWLVLPEAGDGSGNEPQPCVVVSPPEIHDHLAVVTVAPLTSEGASAAYRIPVKLNSQPALVRLEQLRTIDKRALTRQVGSVEGKTLAQMLATLREMFAE